MECATKATKIRRNKWKSICRAALFNDNAPDSEISVTGSSPLKEQQFLISTFLHSRLVANEVVKIAPIGTRTRINSLSSQALSRLVHSQPGH